MIVTQGELLLMLGLSSSATEQEVAVLTVLHGLSEAAVKRALHYDPTQFSDTEYYPRQERSSGDMSVGWNVDAGHSTAIQEVVAIGATQLQLERLPVRVVSSLYSDSDGYFGKGSGAFGSGTLWSEGTDFYGQWERDYYCPSGLLIARSSWCVVPGSIKVTYTGGYSLLELLGQATSTTSSDANSQYSAKNVDASPIRSAVIKTVVNAMNRWDSARKQTAGFVGPLASERAQDYSYTRASSALQDAVGSVTVPADAMDDLEPFVNYGVLAS